MKIRIDKINKNNILKFLYYRGSQIPEEIKNLIDNSIEVIKKNYIARYTYKVFSRKDHLLQPIFIGKDILNILETSTDVILMAVTLGYELERYINKCSYTDLAKSVVLDAAASAAAESLADDINRMLEEEYKPRFLTDRFSPGYGDMPIEVQRNFLDLLNAKKEIGLEASSYGIMQPKKSISAIIGISDIKQQHRLKGCGACKLFKECDYLRRGITCGCQE